jgi:hypothetical protein
VDLRTKNDNLEDVFVRLVGGELDHHGEIKGATPGNETVQIGGS